MAFGLLGCNQFSAEDLSLSRSDSAGVEAVTIRGKKNSLRVLPFTDPDVILEFPDTGGFVGFSSIGAAALIPGGGVAVADLVEKRVFFFDGEGRLTGALGREGGGPGEFRFPSSLSVTRDGELAVFDRRNRRFTLVLPDGKLSRTVPLEAQFRPLDGWITAVGHKIFLTHIGDRTETLPVSSDAVISRLEFCVRGDEPAPVPLCFPGLSEFVATGHRLPLPFGGHPQVEMLESELVVSSGERFEVYWFDHSFRPTAMLRWPDLDQPVSETEVESAWRALEVEQNSPQAPLLAQLFSEDALPEVRPPIGAIVTDPNGGLWVGLAAPFYTVSREWLVFSPEKQPLGRITLPPRATILDAAEGRLLVLQHDSLDVPTISVHQYPTNQE